MLQDWMPVLTGLVAAAAALIAGYWQAGAARDKARQEQPVASATADKVHAETSVVLLTQWQLMFQTSQADLKAARTEAAANHAEAMRWRSAFDYLASAMGPAASTAIAAALAIARQEYHADESQA